MPEGSYTTKLLREGVDRIGRKIGEAAAEVIIAAKNGAPTNSPGRSPTSGITPWCSSPPSAAIPI
jgi:hypothetical protein